jgi:hypothetical protein
LKQFVRIFTNPYRLICKTKESGKLRLSMMIILVTAAFNGFIGPVVTYYMNRNDYDLTLSFVSMLCIFALSGAMYVIDCVVLWFAAKLCGQKVDFKSIAATWGFSFIPTLICSILVNIDETIWYLFVGKPFLLFILNTFFILLLIWKAIFYFMECRVVLQLKGLRLLLSTIGIGILFALLIFAGAWLGLKVPML